MASPALILYYDIEESNFTLILPIFTTLGGSITDIDWDDGAGPIAGTGNFTIDKKHTYGGSGQYTVVINGLNINQMKYDGGTPSIDEPTGANYLIRCDNFGDIGLNDLQYAFYKLYQFNICPIQFAFRNNKHGRNVFWRIVI